MSYGDDPTEEFTPLCLLLEVGLFAPVEFRRVELKRGPTYEQVRDLVEKLATLGGDGLLDDVVHEAKASEAAVVNNHGRGDQVRYLLTCGWTEDEILAEALTHLHDDNDD